MEIGEKEAGDVNVFYLVGRLDTYTAGDFESKLNSETKGLPVNLVICMEKLEYISSSGLRVLLATLKKVRKQQGDVRLTGLRPGVKEVFDISGFTPLFKMFENEEDAINSYKGA
jgi:anti-sigma B factor antagonist